MAFPITDNIESLPKSELSRLQRYLGIILMNPTQGHRLRQVLLSVYRQMGDPFEYLNANGKDPCTMHRLLESFGVLTISYMNETEIRFLKENPYTVWPNDETCMVVEEALDIFPIGFCRENQDYLFSYIRSISPREKKSWSRWLQISDPGRAERKRNRILYARLAGLRSAREQYPRASDVPEYLEDVFPDDLSRYPIAWFYRDVIPFYDSLERTEKIDLTAHQRSILENLKIGKLAIHEEPPEFGKKSLHRLFVTREGRPPIYPGDTGSLFLQGESEDLF
jgi:hypothetical protein